VILACEADRQETDAGQLVPMIEQARENLGLASQQTTTLADAGYGAGAICKRLRKSNCQCWCHRAKANLRPTIPTPANTFLTIRKHEP